MALQSYVVSVAGIHDVQALSFGLVGENSIQAKLSEQFTPDGAE
jgi:hypothetical protein